MDLIFQHKVRRQGAAVKLQALMDAISDNIELLDIRDSKEPDQGYQLHREYIQANDLYLADLGYFSIDTLLSTIVMTINDVEVSLYKAGKVFSNYIRDFIKLIDSGAKNA